MKSGGTIERGRTGCDNPIGGSIGNDRREAIQEFWWKRPKAKSQKGSNDQKEGEREREREAVEKNPNAARSRRLTQPALAKDLSLSLRPLQDWNTVICYW